MSRSRSRVLCANADAANIQMIGASMIFSINVDPYTVGVRCVVVCVLSFLSVCVFILLFQFGGVEHAPCPRSSVLNVGGGGGHSDTIQLFVTDLKGVSNLYTFRRSFLYFASRLISESEQQNDFRPPKHLDYTPRTNTCSFDGMIGD